MAHTYQSATGVPWARYQPLADVLDAQWEHTIAGRRRRIDRRWAQVHPRLNVLSAVDRSHPDADELLEALLGLAADGDPAAGPAILKRHCPGLVAVARSLDLHRSSGPNRPGPDEVLVADAAGIAWMTLATIVRLRPRRPGVRFLYEFRRQLLTAILGRRSDTVTPVLVPVLAGDGAAHRLDRAVAEGRQVSPIAPTEHTAVANVLCDQILAGAEHPRDRRRHGRRPRPPLHPRRSSVGHSEAIASTPCPPPGPRRSRRRPRTGPPDRAGGVNRPHPRRADSPAPADRRLACLRRPSERYRLRGRGSASTRRRSRRVLDVRGVDGGLSVARASGRTRRPRTTSGLTSTDRAARPDRHSPAAGPAHPLTGRLSAEAGLGSGHLAGDGGLGLLDGVEPFASLVDAHVVRAGWASAFEQLPPINDEACLCRARSPPSRPARSVSTTSSSAGGRRSSAPGGARPSGAGSGRRAGHRRAASPA